MLPAASRMRSSSEFDSTVRHGVRVGRPSVVVHASAAANVPADEPIRVGFVVSKRVGNAVMRNRVKRRLRHLARAELTETPGGVSLVVRATAAAASEPERLAADFTSAWHGSLRRLGVEVA